MIYDYLTEEQINKINNFQKNQGPLIIYGKDGSGKTTLGTEILKETILLKIDSDILKKYKNISIYILEILKKKNITLMFKDKIKNRGLLIDDINNYHKYDRINYKSIINFLKKGNFYGTKIIITCNENFKNKDLLKLKYNSVNISLIDYNKLFKNIIKDKKIKISKDNLKRYIDKSNGNINILLSDIKIKKDHLNIKDKQYNGNELITKKILLTKMKLSELLKLCENNDIVIGLNLLENSPYYIKRGSEYLNNIIQIYNNYVYSDLIDTFMIKNHIWDLKSYSIILSSYNINLIIMNNYNRTNKHIYKYNSYISKSLISMNSKNIYDKNKIQYNNIIYYLLNTYVQSKMNKYFQIIKEFYKKYPKIMDKYKKGYEYIYQQKIDLRGINR